MSEFQLWYEKYRPATLDDYVWVSDELKARINYWINSPAKMPHMILYGPSGTGKTTLAELIAAAILGENIAYDLLYINTNKSSGVDAIRDDVTGFCELGGFGGLKVVIIDEADGLSIAAQDKLKGVINDYGDYVRFIFTANKIRQISDALKSRERMYEIKALNEDDFINRMVAILEAEKIEVDADIVATIFERTYPDLRKAIDLLQDCEMDGALIPPPDGASGGAEWAQGVADIIVNKSGAGTIRELVTSLRKDEIVDVYRYLYEHSSDLFDVQYIEMTAITIIASYLKTDATVAFPDINLAGCLIDLVRLQDAT
jgi:DNA polymerase III delta prime subunit